MYCKNKKFWLLQQSTLEIWFKKTDRMVTLQLEYMQIGDASTKDFIIDSLKKNDLIPLLGSGFSCNLTARKGNIPSGTMFKDYMTAALLKTDSSFTKEELGGKNFSWLAEAFFKRIDKNDLDSNMIFEYFSTHFTGIHLNNGAKFKFLNEINWPHIYSLNIDTAIEDSDRKSWDCYFPNRPFYKDNDKKILYKIHGDINQYLKSKNKDELILTQSQYISSLTTNEYFHNSLISNYNNKNILIIGCSLDDELDLQYTVIRDPNKNVSTISNRRIYITHEKLSASKREDLENLNISHIIQLENLKDYDLFYEFILECNALAKNNLTTPLDRYEMPRDLSQLPKDKTKNLDYLANLNSNEQILVPYYFFKRDMVANLSKIGNERLNILIGRRFSGKTMIAYSIIEYFRDRRVYYIKSTETISDATMRLFIEQNNSILIFDSVSISESQLYYLVNESPHFIKNNLFVFILLNSFDQITNLVTFKESYLHLFDKIMDGRLTESEINRVNDKLNGLGIAEFDKKLTILDNTMRIGNIYGLDIASKYSLEGNIPALKLFIWLAIRNKIYFEELVALNLDQQFNAIIKEFAPIIQQEVADFSEGYRHSRIKIVCNSPIALLRILNKYAYPQRTSMGIKIAEKRRQEIGNTIYSIITKTINGDDFLLFDKLNDIFSQQFAQNNMDILSKNKTESYYSLKYGAANIIKAIYENEKIIELKKGEPNYWLQRAKSIYIGTGLNIEALKPLYKGIEFAVKSFADAETRVNNGEYKFRKTMSNSLIQTAMLYGKIICIQNYRFIDTNNKALEYYYTALSDQYNAPAAKSLIEGSKGTKDLKKFIEQIKMNKHCIEESNYEKANFLLNLYGGRITYSLKREYRH